MKLNELKVDVVVMARALDHFFTNWELYREQFSVNDEDPFPYLTQRTIKQHNHLDNADYEHRELYPETYLEPADYIALLGERVGLGLAEAEQLTLLLNLPLHFRGDGDGFERKCLETIVGLIKAYRKLTGIVLSYEMSVYAQPANTPDIRTVTVWVSFKITRYYPAEKTGDSYHYLQLGTVSDREVHYNGD